MKTKDAISSDDLTQKPTGMKTIYSVSWVWNDLLYHISTHEGYELSPEMGLRLAETLMESQM